MSDDIMKEIEKLEKSISSTPTIQIVKTDTLIMEYVTLPVIDLSFCFLFRFVEPVATIWREGRISYFERMAELAEEGKVLEFNQPLHENGIKTFRLKRFALEQWEMVVLNGTSKDELPEDAKWLVELKDAKIYECEIVRK